MTGRKPTSMSKRERAAEEKRAAEFWARHSETIRVELLKRAQATSLVFAKLGLPEKWEESKGLNTPETLTYTISGRRVVVNVW